MHRTHVPDLRQRLRERRFLKLRRDLLRLAIEHCFCYRHRAAPRQIHCKRNVVLRKRHRTARADKREHAEHPV